MNDINNTRPTGTNGDPLLHFYPAGDVENARKAMAANRPDLTVGDREYLEKLLSLLSPATPQTYLDPPKASPWAGAEAALKATESFDFYQVSVALFEVSKLLRHANREMRHAERDAAMSENLNAAAKIRGAALSMVICSIIGSAMSMSMSIYSGAKSFSAARNAGIGLNKTKGSHLEMRQFQSHADQAKSQAQLKLAKTELAQTGQNMEASNAKLDAAKQEVIVKQRLVTEVETSAAMVRDNHSLESQQVKAADAAVKTAKTDLAQAQAKQATAETEVKTKTEAHEAAAAKVERMEVEVRDKATVATKTNKKNQTYLEKQKIANDQKIINFENQAARQPENSPRAVELKAQAAELKKENTVIENKIEACRTNAAAFEDPTDPAALDRAGADHIILAQRISPEGDVGQAYQAAQNDYNATMVQAQHVSAQVQVFQTGIQGVTQLTHGVGEYASSQQRAEGQEATARAQKHQASEQENTDFQNSFNDLIRQVQDTIRKWQECMNQANAQIIRNI